MNLLKTTITALALVAAQQGLATDFDSDRQNFYVDGQSINEALESINFIVCTVAAARTDSLVNDGPYLATLYEEDCEPSAASASDDSAAATKSSSQSASTATASTTTTVDAKTATEAVVAVTRLNSASPAKAAIWFKSPAENPEEGDINEKIYIDLTQYGAVSETSPNGDFEMRYSQHADGDQQPWEDMPDYIEYDNQGLGEGYLKADGTTVKFREQGRQGQSNVAANFYANGDKAGIYGEQAGFGTWDWEANDNKSPEELGLSWDDYPHVDVSAFYQFYVSVVDKGYCRRLLSAERTIYKTGEEQDAIRASLEAELDLLLQEADESVQLLVDEAEAAMAADPSFEPDWDAIYNSVDWDAIHQSIDWDSAWQPNQIIIYDVATGEDDLSRYAQSELVIGEECFTVDQAKVQRNVHRYGVYNTDGSRLAVLNPPFSMVAELTQTLDDGTEEAVNAYAWAGYWGTHLDRRVRSLVTNDTVFSKEGYNEDPDAEKQKYNLKTTDIRVEKRTTSYIALNDINKINLAMWIDDDYWRTQYTSLFGSELPYQELEGSYDVETKTFTMTKGITHNGDWQQTDLATPITFTTDEWIATMFNEGGVSIDLDGNRIEEDWYYKDIRNMGVWSHDTRQWYDISSGAMANPVSATRDAGIRTETNEIVNPADITETLYCIRDCLDGAKVEQAFTDAVDETFSGLIDSPYANISERLKEAVTTTRVNRGFYSFNEASNGFAESISTNTDNKIVFGREGIAVTDYVGGVRSRPLYSRAAWGGVSKFNDLDSDNVSAAGALDMYTWDGFSKGNIDSLLNYNNKTADNAEVDRLLSTVPSISIDLESIPAAGSSGTMLMIVTVLQGDNDTKDSGEAAVSAEATVRWSSTGSGFRVAIDQGTQITYTYITKDNGIGVSAKYNYPRYSDFAYSGGELDIHQQALDLGLRFNIFDMFVGSARLQALIDADFASFFETGRYNASIQILNTDLAVSRIGFDYDTQQNDVESNKARKVNLFFDIYADSDVLYEETYEAGRWVNGLQLADMMTYSVVAGKLVDSNGNEIKKGVAATAALAAVDDPYALLSGAMYYEDEFGFNTRTLAWGAHMGELVPASELANLECRKVGKDLVYELHPIYGTSTDVARYCGNQLWEGDVEVKYSVNVETHAQYGVYYANAVDASAVIGEQVRIDPPKTMYYTVPETLTDGVATFGDDAGKRIRLEYNGHGQLWGIPGFVYDTATGEDLGEHIQGEWKQSYRYLNRFIMTDGTLIEDGVDSTVSYKVKALDGEVWLTPADGSIAGVGDLTGSYTDVYFGAVSDLVDREKLRVIGFEDWGTFDENGGWVSEERDGVNDNSQYLGDQPIPTVNGGSTAVVHGEVLFDPTP